MKPIITVILLLIASYTGFSQTGNSGGSQHMQMNFAEVVGANLSTSGGSGGGSTVDIPLSGTNALANGIESPEITINLQGTTGFDVSVQASSTAFTYSGTGTGNTNMLVKDVLSIAITSNNTGGSVAGSFNFYQLVDGVTPQKVIGNGQRGVRSFGFKYKANPGFNYAAGLYTTNIVYTISKI